MALPNNWHRIRGERPLTPIKRGEGELAPRLSSASPPDVERRRHGAELAADALDQRNQLRAEPGQLLRGLHRRRAAGVERHHRARWLVIERHAEHVGARTERGDAE